MTSKKRKYGDLSARPLPTEGEDLIDDVFAAFTGPRPRPEEGGLPTTPHDSPPVTTTPPAKQLQGTPRPATAAPARDFNRRANSLERDALPQGLFPGSSKKIYDALYLRSRGANPPRATVRASRRDFLDWTDIRNMKTVDGHLRYLMSVGLIVRNWQLGATEGSEYAVRLPEELPPLTTTHHHSPLLHYPVVGMPSYRGVVGRVKPKIFKVLPAPARLLRQILSGAMMRLSPGSSTS